MAIQNGIERNGDSQIFLTNEMIQKAAAHQAGNFLLINLLFSGYIIFQLLSASSIMVKLMGAPIFYYRRRHFGFKKCRAHA
ncbi:MAG: hypothetical protein HY882_08150 [Deltaproteobacteria bacterium]|nr:hypothetical protein [Deltaproteobacteria bacterium]